MKESNVMATSIQVGSSQFTLTPHFQERLAQNSSIKEEDLPEILLNAVCIPASGVRRLLRHGCRRTTLLWSRSKKLVFVLEEGCVLRTVYDALTCEFVQEWGRDNPRKGRKRLRDIQTKEGLLDEY